MSCASCIRLASPALLAILAFPGGPTCAAAQPGEIFSGALCVDAIHAAEVAYAIPAGLLEAMGEVESGRFNQATGRVQPWPWTVQAGDRSYVFGSKQQAVRWVSDATARGVASIDTGCLQISLLFHPHAFETIEEAFDPRTNVDYAARFLRRLHSVTGDWKQATGFYHSQTPALAVAYAARVERRLTSPASALPQRPAKPSRLTSLSAAWQATLADGQPATASGAYGSWATPPRAESVERLQRMGLLWSRMASQ